MSQIMERNVSKIPVGPRGVAPVDRPISVTMTADEWRIVLNQCGRSESGPAYRSEHAVVEVTLNKLETQLGGAA